MISSCKSQQFKNLITTIMIQANILILLVEQNPRDHLEVLSMATLRHLRYLRLRLHRSPRREREPRRSLWQTCSCRPTMKTRFWFSGRSVERCLGRAVSTAGLVSKKMIGKGKSPYPKWQHRTRTSKQN